MANELAKNLGLLSEDDANRIESLLKKIAAPTDFKIEDINGFYDHFFLDKKSEKGRIAFILPNKKIGSHIIKRDIKKDIILDSLKKFKG